MKRFLPFFALAACLASARAFELPKNPLYVILPDDEYSRLRNEWKLP